MPSEPTIETGREASTSRPAGYAALIERYGVDVILHWHTSRVATKRHDGDGDGFINPARVAMVEPSTVGDGNVTDVVVAAQDGLALVRVREPIKDVVDKLRRETPGRTGTSRRAKKTPKTSSG